MHEAGAHTQAGTRVSRIFIMWFTLYFLWENLHDTNSRVFRIRVCERGTQKPIFFAFLREIVGCRRFKGCSHTRTTGFVTEKQRRPTYAQLKAAVVAFTSLCITARCSLWSVSRVSARFYPIWSEINIKPAERDEKRRSSHNVVSLLGAQSIHRGAYLCSQSSLFPSSISH